MHRSRSSLLLAALVLSAVSGASALAATEGATIDKTGWWNRANTTTATPAGPVTVPPPPGVPEGDLVVGAANGEASALTAIGIQPDDDPGATVISFTLTVTEDPEADGNRNTEDAVIIACPITDFWAGGENGDWETRPTFDCDAASVTGLRAEDGTWTFDLAPIGALWFDTFGTIRADGVILREEVDPPASFQAVFLGGDDIDVVLETEPAPDADDPFATPTTFQDPPADAGLNSGPGGGGSSVFSPPVVTSPPSGSATPDFSDPTPADDPGDVTEDDDLAAPSAVDAPDQTPVASSRAGELVGNLSPLVLLALPLFLGLLVVTSYWLGPAGQPVTTVRQRGVSRALEARSRAEKGS